VALCSRLRLAASTPGLKRVATDTGLLRIPDRLARELVVYYIGEGALADDSDDVLRTIIDSVALVPIESAHIYEERGRDARRYATILLDAEHGARFMAVFPEADRLRNPAPGKAAFRVAGCTVEHGQRSVPTATARSSRKRARGSSR
jgi:hypothetical protein